MAEASKIHKPFYQQNAAHCAAVEVPHARDKSWTTGEHKYKERAAPRTGNGDIDMTFKVGEV